MKPTDRIDPDTLEPVKEGDIGEMVVTTLNKEAAPLIRYRTRDLTRLIPNACSCGNILPLHDRIMGRTDDMIIFRAVNIYPGQIDEMLADYEEWAHRCSVMPWDELLELRREKDDAEGKVGTHDELPLG